MKKTIIIAFCAVLLLLAFSACTSQQPAQNNSMHTLAISEWPQNEYTAVVPQPQAGTPVAETVNGEIYGISLSGVSRQDCYDYLALLGENGFESALPGEENDASGGWLYTNGAVSVTVSQSGDSMQIGISLEP